MLIKKGASIILLIAILATFNHIPAAAAPPAAPPIPLNIHFETIVTGLNMPVFGTHAGDGSGRLFIVERGGQIKILKNGAVLATPFLDIGGLLVLDGNEQGLLGLAFAPDYSSSGTFYVSYTAPFASLSMPYAITLARYKVSGNPDIANAASGEVLLRVPKTYTNHNGGMLAFGPDQFLYMTTGDGGSGGDPSNNAQNRKSLLGKLLRLDVSGSGAYTIPTTNPYFNDNSGLKKEIWSYGLRNAWRFSFDRQTGDLYIADVGQNIQEEVNFQSKTSAGGQNYGWRILEGNLCYNPANCTPPANYVAPILVYNHGTNSSTGCAVTGGYVYRGAAFPELKGTYLYGDFCSGRLWGTIRNASNKWVNTQIVDTKYHISAFAEAENGELYILEYSGQLIHIARAPIKSVSFVSNAALDGFIAESAENSNTGGAFNNSSAYILVGDSAPKRQFRAILSFNTINLPDSAVILSARLKLQFHRRSVTDPFSSLGALLIDIRKPYFGAAGTLGLDDFAAVANRNGAGTIAPPPSGSVYTGNLPAASFPFINLSGPTQLRLRFQTDDNNDSVADFLAFSSADTTTAAFRPVLQITYYIP